MEDAWKRFEGSGSVYDYLSYKMAENMPEHTFTYGRMDMASGSAAVEKGEAGYNESADEGTRNCTFHDEYRGV